MNRLVLASAVVSLAGATALAISGERGPLLWLPIGVAAAAVASMHLGRVA